MRRLSKLAFVAFACVLVISAVAVMSPRAVHAVVATLVKDVDNPARHAFTTSCIFTPTAGQATGCTTPAIPAGEQVVIETVAVIASANPTNTELSASISTTVNGATATWPFSVADNGTNQPGNSLFWASQPLRLYADPGTTIVFGINTKGLNPPLALGGGAGISGYWVSLP